MSVGKKAVEFGNIIHVWTSPEHQAGPKSVLAMAIIEKP
jgi:hypothetical protein